MTDPSLTADRRCLSAPAARSEQLWPAAAPFDRSAVHARGTTQSRARDHTFTAQAAAGPMEQQQCGHRPPLCLCGCALLRHTCVTRAHAATRPMRALVVLAALRSATAPTRVPSPTALAGLDPAAIRARVSSCGNFGVGDVHTWLRPERLVALANAGDEEGCVYVCALHRTYPRPGMGAAPQPDSTSRAACLETHRSHTTSA
jgi:hypothetical protein